MNKNIKILKDKYKKYLSKLSDEIINNYISDYNYFYQFDWTKIKKTWLEIGKYELSPEEKQKLQDLILRIETCDIESVLSILKIKLNKLLSTTELPNHINEIFVNMVLFLYSYKEKIAKFDRFRNYFGFSSIPLIFQEDEHRKYIEKGKYINICSKYLLENNLVDPSDLSDLFVDQIIAWAHQNYFEKNNPWNIKNLTDLGQHREGYYFDIKNSNTINYVPFDLIKYNNIYGFSINTKNFEFCIIKKYKFSN